METEKANNEITKEQVELLKIAYKVFCEVWNDIWDYLSDLLEADCNEGDQMNKYQEVLDEIKKQL